MIGELEKLEFIAFDLETTSLFDGAGGDGGHGKDA